MNANNVLSLGYNKMSVIYVVRGNGGNKNNLHFYHWTLIALSSLLPFPSDRT